MKALLGFLFVCSAMGLMLTTALAGTVSLQPIYNSADQVQLGLVPGLTTLATGWIIFELRNLAMRWPFFFRLLATPTAQRAVQQIVNDGFSNAVQFALNQEHAWETVHQSVQVQGVVQSIAANYFMDHYASSAKKMGLDAASVSTKLLAFIPAPPATAVTAALNAAQLAKG